MVCCWMVWCYEVGVGLVYNVGMMVSRYLSVLHLDKLYGYMYSYYYGSIMIVFR